MVRLLLVALMLLTAAFIISYNLGTYQEKKRRDKRNAKAEFEKNIDKLAEAILKRKYE